MIDNPSRFLFPADYAEAVALQNELRRRVVVAPWTRTPRWAAGLDISYDRGDDLFFAAAVLLDVATWEVVEESFAMGRATFPYIPGLLGFREAPLLIETLKKLKGRPDVLFCDGHGLAHPRRCGIACHLGVLMETPAIGVAKKRLIGRHDEPGPTPGDAAPLRDNEETIGLALRSRKAVKPIFISVGHLTNLDQAFALTLSAIRGRRIPEPTRLAHLAVNRRRREHGAACQPGTNG